MRTPAVIEIPVNKKKIGLYLLVSIAFVAAGIWFVVAAPTSAEDDLFSDPMVVKGFGWAAIVLFGFGIYIFTKKLLDKKPGLVINPEGLSYYYSMGKTTVVRWEDIIRFDVYEVSRQKMIMVQVKNPQEHLKSRTSALLRKLAEGNISMYGTPVVIAANPLQIKLDDLVLLLETRLKESRESGGAI